MSFNLGILVIETSACLISVAGQASPRSSIPKHQSNSTKGRSNDQTRAQTRFKAQGGSLMLKPSVLSRFWQFQDHRIDSQDDTSKVEEGSSCMWTNYLIKSLHSSID
jgi:hypothetical protein